MNFLLLIFISVFSSALALPAEKRSTLTPPSKDDFYNAPEGFESSAPGTILKKRVTPAQIRSIVLPVKIKNAWQLLVRSTDSHGNPNAIVTTLLEPYNADTNRLVSHQIAEDSSSPDCAVSYGLQEGAPVINTFNSQIEMVLIQSFLQEGYFVVLPDYEGPKAAYIAGRQAGHATLDSIRAVLGSGLSGISKDAKTMLYGYSGGSLASGWAAALQPTYAPELKSNLLGAAVGGFVTNITATAQSIDGTAFSGLISGALTGLAAEYPDLKAALPNYTSKQGLLNLEWATTQCLVGVVTKFLFTHWFSGHNPVFPIGMDVFRINITANIMEQNTLGLASKTDEVPQIPMFIFQSKNDEVVPFKEVERTFNTWKQLGAPSIEFNADLLAGHVTEYVSGAPAAFNWIKKTMGGVQPVQGCKRNNRLNNLLIPGTPLGIYKILASTVRGLLLQNFGPTFPGLSSIKRELDEIDIDLEKRGLIE